MSPADLMLPAAATLRGQRLDMRGDRRKEKGLKLLHGGRGCELRVGGVAIVVSPPGTPPFPVDARVAEEDRYFVLSAEPAVWEAEEHVVRLMTEVIETRPAEPGSVAVKRGRPMKFLAVVHDLDEEPTWREEWVERAIREVFRQMEHRRLESVALPMIGSRHGTLQPRRFAELLRSVMETTSFSSVRRLWLVAQGEAAVEALRTLEGGRDE